MTARQSHLLARGFQCHQYPILGAVIAGPIEPVTTQVWELIWRYDHAQACNLIIQPGSVATTLDTLDTLARVRIFVFPRRRALGNYKVTEQLDTCLMTVTVY